MEIVIIIVKLSKIIIFINANEISVQNLYSFNQKVRFNLKNQS